MITQVKEFEDDNTVYRIVGIKENYQQSKEITVNIQVKNSSRSFCMSVKDIYQKNWLKFFSKEDCTYLAVLYVAEKEKNPEIIKLYPRKRSTITTSVLGLAILYSAFLIIANLAGSKIINIWDFTFPAVLVFFPFTYIIDDILTEVYGFSVSRKVIWWGLFASVITTAAVCIIVWLEPSQYWTKQRAFEEVFMASPRIVLASILAYIGGEFLNAICLAKLKVHTSGRHLWFRSVASTMVGSFFDSIIFCCIAFAGIISNDILFKMVISQYLIKTIYAFVAVPIVYKATNYLKRLDDVDVYDYKTSFNPFSA